jgi:hypothetical protein
VSLGVGPMALGLQQTATATYTALAEAIPFPSHDHIDVIHGHGSIALDLENGLAAWAQGSSARPRDLKFIPDFVIGDMTTG